jgi:lipopolysaccharide/colanic/teichoic acid biosynthesis glycosyltransferase
MRSTLENGRRARPPSNDRPFDTACHPSARPADVAPADGAGPAPADEPVAIPTVTLRPWKRWSKRGIDLALAPVLLALAAPAVAAAAIAVKLDSTGPVIFRQQRVGKGGRIFTMYKLRTMFVDNDDRRHREYVAGLLNGTARRTGSVYKLSDDPRITRVGRVIRRLSLDEVPQLFNVITGDMSLVGPRPALATEVALYQPHQLGRLAVQPGITGLWQVSGRCELTYLEMIELDLQYVKRIGPRLDLAILAKTPGTVLSRRGAA